MPGAAAALAAPAEGDVSSEPGEKDDPPGAVEGTEAMGTGVAELGEAPEEEHLQPAEYADAIEMHSNAAPLFAQPSITQRDAVVQVVDVEWQRRSLSPDLDRAPARIRAENWQGSPERQTGNILFILLCV